MTLVAPGTSGARLSGSAAAPSDFVDQLATGVSGTWEWSRRYRTQRACGALRSVVSTLVSRPLIPAIMLERVS